MPVKWRIVDKTNVTMLEFQIEGGVLDPQELPEAIDKMPQIQSEKPVCISGRGPVWLYSAASVKLAESGNTVATYEPRMNACIITTGPEKGRVVKPE